MNAAAKLMSLTLDVIIFVGGIGLTITLFNQIAELITQYFELIK